MSSVSSLSRWHSWSVHYPLESCLRLWSRPWVLSLGRWCWDCARDAPQLQIPLLSPCLQNSPCHQCPHTRTLRCSVSFIWDAPHPGSILHSSQYSSRKKLKGNPVTGTALIIGNGLSNRMHRGLCRRQHRGCLSAGFASAVNTLLAGATWTVRLCAWIFMETFAKKSFSFLSEYTSDLKVPYSFPALVL